MDYARNMDNVNSDHIAMLRVMSSLLRDRKSSPFLSDFRRKQLVCGIEALDKAVDALQVEIQA